MNRWAVMVGSMVMAAGALQVSGCEKANAQNTSKESRAIELTVYKADFAEVRESRQVALNAGTTHLELRDVSKALDPKSVTFQWPGSTGHDVTANTYDLGVGDGEGLLKRFVGHEVELCWRSQNGNEGQKIKGELEVANGGIVLKVGDKYYVNPDGTIIAPSGESIVTSPTLSADVQSEAAGNSKLRTSYLTRGMDWSADYVGTVLPDRDVMRLECWATITNRTGINYPQARISLVTGEPNAEVSAPEQEPQSTREEVSSGLATDFRARPKREAFSPRAVGELYSYDVPAPATIGQDQMNRVKMMTAERVPIVRDYSVLLAPGQGDATRQNAQMAIVFKNEQSSGLGKPLPQGSVRVYESSGDRQPYVGGSSIGDVPKGDKVTLTLSDTIDIYSRSQVVKTSRVNKHRYQRTFHADLTNEKKKEVSLRVVFATDETAKVISQSTRSRRKDASTLEWTIKIPAESKVPLEFTIESRY